MLKIAKFLKEQGHVDMRRIFLQTSAKSGDPRNGSLSATIAYRIPGVTDRQPLIRFIYAVDLNNEQVPLLFYEHHVNNPDDTSLKYSANQFNNELIYLQDLADQEKVTKYAADFYACQPLTENSGGDGMKKRQKRTQADPKALDVKNYYYNHDVWDKYQQPLDMWNEPALMFRMDCIYDRGDTEYATKTAGGHTLTPVALYKGFLEEDYKGGIDDEFSAVYSFFGTVESLFKQPTNELDGKPMTLPSWENAWVEE